jgi:hypothetical protein
MILEKPANLLVVQRLTPEQINFRTTDNLHIGCHRSAPAGNPQPGPQAPVTSGMVGLRLYGFKGADQRVPILKTDCFLSELRDDPEYSTVRKPINRKVSSIQSQNSIDPSLFGKVHEGGIRKLCW